MFMPVSLLSYPSMEESTSWLAFKGKRGAAIVSALKKAKTFSMPKMALPKQPLWWKTKPVDEDKVVLSPVTPLSKPVVPGMTAAMGLRARLTKAVVHSNARMDLTSEGCGGAYMIQLDDEMLAIFKPRDEEYMGPNNPRGYSCPTAVVGETVHAARKGFRVGDGAVREVAAYLLDAAYGHFSGVPTTHFLHLPVNGVWKEGSIQSFVPSVSSAEDIGSRCFALADVHKVGILDIRLFNTDRHAGNLLLQKHDAKASTFSMVPIDHGLCLPAIQTLDGACFEWLHWPQAKFPFSADALAHIATLDIAADAATLRSIGVSEDCIATMMVSTELLKQGAASGFSLYDIGSAVQRDGAGLEQSKLEHLVENVLTQVADVSAPTFMDVVSDAVECLWADADKCKGRSMSSDL